MCIDRSVSRKPRLVDGVKGHTMNETSSARILFATACPGSPGPNGREFMRDNPESLSTSDLTTGVFLVRFLPSQPRNLQRSKTAPSMKLIRHLLESSLRD